MTDMPDIRPRPTSPLPTLPVETPKERPTDPEVDHRHDVSPGGGNPMAQPASPMSTPIIPEHDIED